MVSISYSQNGKFLPIIIALKQKYIFTCDLADNGYAVANIITAFWIYKEGGENENEKDGER